MGAGGLDAPHGADFAGHVAARVAARAAAVRPPAGRPGISLTPLRAGASATGLSYSTVEVGLPRQLGAATLKVPARRVPAGRARSRDRGGRPGWWALAACRELDDAILHLRFNEPELGTWVLAHRGRRRRPCSAARRAMRRAHRSLAGPRGPGRTGSAPSSASTCPPAAWSPSIEPGSCFAGTLAELALAADRSFMLDGHDGDDEAPPAATGSTLPTSTTGWYPMANGLSPPAQPLLGSPRATWTPFRSHVRQGADSPPTAVTSGW